jgi:hypothetical protein
MGDKNCPYFGIAPATFMRMEYCKLQSNEDNPENYHFVACTSDKWELCEIILKKKLEKELDEF